MTGPEDSVDPTEPGHLTFAQLDDLVASEVGQEAAPNPLVRRHLESCSVCREALADQVAVRDALRSAGEELPLPADLGARLDAALAGAASVSTATGDVLPMHPTTARATFLGRLAESRVTKSVVGVAAAGLIAVGAYAAVHRPGENAQTSAASGASAAASNDAAKAPDLTHTRVISSGTSYTKANAKQQALALLGHTGDHALAAPEAESGGTTAGSGTAGTDGTSGTATTLTTPAGLAACIQALGGASGPPELADLATFEGKPVAVLVLPAADGTRALWVVSRSCSLGKEGVAYYAPLG